MYVYEISKYIKYVCKLELFCINLGFNYLLWFLVSNKRVHSNLKYTEEEEAAHENEQNRVVPPGPRLAADRPIRKRKQDQPEAQLDEVLVKNLKWRQEIEQCPKNYPGRFLLLLLLGTFKKFTVRQNYMISEGTDLTDLY